jgi:small neutral amino acid transporter SnatA (MarC family)
MQVAVFPLAVPYLLNPAGIVALVTLSAEASSLVVYAVAVGVLVVVLAIDIAVFPPGCPGQQRAGREPDAAPMPRP